MSLRWVIAGGGTGGHITPALAVGEAVRDDGEALLFIGAERGLETRLVPDAGFALETLDARPLVARRLGEQLAALVALLRGIFAARRLLREFGASVVVAVGGYACAAPALAAWTLGIPVVLVNTDALPGAANRLLSRVARAVFVGFEAAVAVFQRAGQRPDAIHVVGVPLRSGMRRAFANGATPPRGERLRLLVFGGSQGAHQINHAMVEALPFLAKGDRFEIFHQTGESDRDEVAAAYRAAGVDAEVVAFERDMPARYRWADLAVCRAGAISVAELALAGLPALFVPLAHTGGGEQLENARQRERAGAARVLDPSPLRSEELIAALDELASDRGRLAAMAEAARREARPDATQRIVEATRALVLGQAEAAA